ncbi:hypothetical protein EQ875_00925 [Photobacterium damselae subsp. damselae]|nr:hypothetical protein EQ875_00925 [Photobacterium damselae subsp. damselae]
MITNKKITRFSLLSSLLLTPLLSHASIPTHGDFTAKQACDAFQSFRKQSNPQNVQLSVGQRYEITAINKEAFDWVQIKVPGSSPLTRWVKSSCGESNFLGQSKPTTKPSTPNNNKGNGSCSTAGNFDSYVLALTWQPGFCEHFSYKGKKPECDAINSGKLASTNLTLHGLWPNKKSCGTNYGYCDDSNKLDLSRSTINKIAPWMPNFYYQTKFGEYEWRKHGTCQTQSADQYFMTAVDLVKQVDASEIGQYIKENIGRNIKADQFKQALVDKMGKEAVNRIRLSCTKGKYLNEVRINLPEPLDMTASLVSQMEKAPRTKSFYGNCKKIIHIEAAGK